MKWPMSLLLGLLLWGNANAQWVSSQRLAKTACFFFSQPARVERFDLENRVWLKPIPIPTNYGLPVCGCIDADGIFLAQENTVCRYDLDGKNQTHLGNHTEKIVGLLTDGNLLFVNRSNSSYARFTSINKTTNTVVSSFENYIDSLSGASIAPSINKIFGRSEGVSPSDITYVTYDSSGQFLGGGDSPHHGDYPTARKTWVFPDESKVVDSSGTMYTTAALNYSGSLGTSITDVQFLENGNPILTHGNVVTAYSNAMLPLGSSTLPFTPSNLYLDGADLIVFGPDNSEANGIRFFVKPLADLNTQVEDTPIDPKGLAYKPDDLFLAQDGVLFLFSKIHSSIFRWSTKEQRYLETISLTGNPEFTAHSAENHTIYVACTSGLINRIDLSSEEWSEESFAILPTIPVGLATAGRFVFTADLSGAWCTHRTFNAQGMQVDAVDWNYESDEYVWNKTTQKMYFFRDDTSPNDLIWEQINESGAAYAGESTGGIGTQFDSPLHTSEPFLHPIRVSPDGSRVVLGSGFIFDGTSLEQLPVSLANTVTDVIWLDSGILTCRTSGKLVEYQLWTGPTLAPSTVKQYPGNALRLFALGSGKVLGVSMSGNLPSFEVMAEDFTTLPPSSLEAPVGLAMTTPSSGRLLLRWSDVTGESEYVIERKQGDSNDWSEIGRTIANISRFEFDTVHADQTFDYRVIAVNGTLTSAPSIALENVVSGPPLKPAAFSAKAGTGDTRPSALLSWNDAELETGYRLEFRASGGRWKTLAYPEEDITRFSAKGMRGGTEYEFRLCAVNQLGSSPWIMTKMKTPKAKGEISIEQPSGAPLADGKSIKTFGTTTYASDGKTKLLYIVNRGDGELSKLRISITGAAAGDYEVNPLPRTSLPSGRNLSFPIKFLPKKLGTRRAVLHIHSDDEDEKSFDILLTGEATLP